MTEAGEIKLRKIIRDNLIDNPTVDDKPLQSINGSPVLLIEDFDRLLIDLIMFYENIKR